MSEQPDRLPGLDRATSASGADSSPKPGRFSPGSRSVRRYAIEALVGLAIAAVLLWVAIASKVDVPFIYQGH